VTDALFSYGSLQQEAAQLSTFGRRLTGDRDELPGFTLGTSGPHADAVFSGRWEDRIAGARFDVTAAEVAAADEYERADQYKRVGVTLATGRAAWVYVSALSGPAATDYEIDGAGFGTLDELFDHFGARVIPGAAWGRNMNALNDVLRGGFGTPDEGFSLRWIRHEQSRQRLGDALFEDIVRIVRKHGPGGEEADDRVMLILD
jgi:gamma-glutamylcyclotransferase (GGCT)/AIG2-like uncharacterized protein YtfP